MRSPLWILAAAAHVTLISHPDAVAAMIEEAAASAH